jgi:hypothetical protein
MVPQSNRLDESQLNELLELLKGADSVELKLSVAEERHRSTTVALGMDVIEAQIRQVYFFDTPDLSLNAAGVVVRGRRVQGKSGDSVVKLRPVTPAELPKGLRKLPGFGVEVDAMPGGFVCSGRLKAPADNGLIMRVSNGDAALRKLFTKQQRALFEEHAPDGVSFEDLVALGPILVLKLPFTPADLGHKMVAEVWFYPDGSRILELSTKCLPSELLGLLPDLRAYLGAHGVDRTGVQQAKTKTALTYFSKQLQVPETA